MSCLGVRVINCERVIEDMEACNGGSMFASILPTDINVFATTAETLARQQGT